jgi:hypothetical protein
MPGASVSSTGVPMAPFVALSIAGVLAVALALAAWASGAGSTSELSKAAIAGWICGSVIALLLFAWFRASTAGRQADPYFVEPSWRPTRVAGVVAGVAWLAGVGCAFLVGAAVARR